MKSPTLAKLSFQKGDGYCVLSLFVLAAYFCHRFFCLYFPVEGDTLQNLYFWYERDLFTQEYLPNEGNYSSYMPFIGLNNPFSFVISLFLKMIFPGLSKLERAFAICCLTSAFLLGLIGSSVFVFLRSCRRTRVASVLGAIIVSFTGFHSAVALEFNHMYLVSFAMVPWVLIFSFHYFQSKGRATWGWLLSMSIGISLLGASNAPLFYYMPVIGLIPLLYFEKSSTYFLQTCRFFGFLLLGVLVASATLLPAISFVEGTNRGQLFFWGDIDPLQPIEKLMTLFYRDWWRPTGNLQYHELDFFLGLPVVILAVLGMGYSGSKFIKRHESLFMILCLILAVLVTECYHFSFLSGVIGFFFQKLSIRFPNRFFLLALLPVAYFSAKGLDILCKVRKAFLVLAFLTAVGLGAAFSVVENLYSDELTGWFPFIMSFGLSLVGSVLLLFLSLFLSRRAKWAVVGSVFFMYSFSFNQLSLYNKQHSLTADVKSRFPEGKVSGWQWAGFEWNYPEILKRIEKDYFRMPEFLQASATKSGTIWDPISKYHPYSKTSGHHFILSRPDDPATPKLLRELYEIKNENILDLMNICWVMQPNGIEKRPNCLPHAYLLPELKSVSKDAGVLKTLQMSSISQLKQRAITECSTSNCPELTGGEEFAGKEPVISSPDREVYELEISRPSVFVLNIPYRWDWVAYINGSVAPVIRVNHAFMGVLVEAGQSRIIFELQNPLKKISGYLSFFFLGLCLLGIFWDFRLVTQKFQAVRNQGILKDMVRLLPVLMMFLLMGCGRNSDISTFTLFGSGGTGSLSLVNLGNFLMGPLHLRLPETSRGSGSPRSIKGTFYSVYLGESYDCSDAFLVKDYGDLPKRLDLLRDPVLFDAQPPEGLYSCIIVKLLDQFRFKPNSDAVAGNTGCDSEEVEYYYDRYLASDSSANTFRVPDGGTITATGTVAAPVADTIYLYGSTSPTTLTSGGIGANSLQVIRMVKPLRIPGSVTFKVDYADKVTSQSSRCWLENSSDALVFPS